MTVKHHAPMALQGAPAMLSSLLTPMRMGCPT